MIFVADFSSAESDRIDVSALVPGDFALIGSAPFSDGGGPELQATDFGGGFNFVAGDTDGDGTADFFISVVATGPLSASDFFLRLPLAPDLW